MKKPFKIDVSILKGSETQKNVDDLRPESAEAKTDQNSGSEPEPKMTEQTSTSETKLIKPFTIEAGSPGDLTKPFTCEIPKQNPESGTLPEADTAKEKSAQNPQPEADEEQEKIILNPQAYCKSPDKPGHQVVVHGSDALADCLADKAKEIIANIGDAELLKRYLCAALASYKKDTGHDLNLKNYLKEAQNSSSLNFKLSLMRKEIVVTDTENGEESDLFYIMKVTVCKRNGFSKSYDARVAGKDVKSVEWLKRATNSIAMIPKEKDEKIEFMEMVQDCIEREDAPVEIVYPNAGWRQVPNVGWRYVYAGGVIGADNPWTHTGKEYTLLLNGPAIGTGELFKLAMSMGEVTKNSVALDTMIFTHATVLSTLFKTAGFPINFVFGIVGVTNSRKTSLVLALAKIFGRKNLVADAEFATATNCGIEKVLGTYHDAPVIVDDFKPGATPMQQKALDSKLDELLRFYGNRVTKKRMTDFMPAGSKKYFPISGGCIITMEIVNGVQSSLSRMFLVELKDDDVINPRLKTYQTERWILPSHIYDFVAWVTPRFDAVVKYIGRSVEDIRAERRFALARHNEMYSVMLTTCKILCQYAAEKGFWTREQCQQFFAQATGCFMADIRMMEARFKALDKGLLAIQALGNALKSGKLSPLALTHESCQRQAESYQDDTYVYIKTNRLSRLIHEYCLANYIPDPIVNNEELLSLLERLKVLDILEGPNGRERSRKLPIQRGNAMRYLYLSKTKMAELLTD